jgi:hypothetical protein
MPLADSPAALTKLMPGFEFLQGLVKNAGAAMPSVGQWIAPTLDPAELDKRIEELRTVQFWLEQNARMLAATIQALEVQRMTLSALKTMNVTVGDLSQAMKLRSPANALSTSAASDASAGHASKTASRAPGAVPTPAAAAGVVDPMQWWGALTQQFTQLAVQAMKDGKKAAAVPGAVARSAQQAVKAAAKPARARKAKRR